MSDSSIGLIKTDSMQIYEEKSEQTRMNRFISDLTDMYRSRIIRKFERLLSEGIDPTIAAESVYKTEWELINLEHEVFRAGV